MNTSNAKELREERQTAILVGILLSVVGIVSLFKDLRYGLLLFVLGVATTLVSLKA
jgi:hypothetical protein